MIRMALQPPSFFQTLNKDTPKQDSALTAAAGSGQPPPSCTVSSQSSHQQHSNASRYTHGTVVHLPVSPSTIQCPVVGGTHLSSNTSHLCSPPVQPAVLANDLLQVEAHLQSKLRLLETEKRELSMQVLELERRLLQEGKQHQEAREEMVAQHKDKLLQAMTEKECLSDEYQSYKTETESRLSRLDEELTAVQKQHAAEMEAFETRVAELDCCNASLTSDLHHQSQSHEEELNQLRQELAKMANDSQLLRGEMEKQIETLNTQLTQKCQQIHQLESYLGGEIPSSSTNNGDQHGDEGITQPMTWKEEREMLYATIKNHERDLQRLQSEDKLLNIRLSSITEILNIQEADITKQYKATETGSQDEDSSKAVRSLLSRWREKVFELLVQQRLQEMQIKRDRHTIMKREAALMEQVEQLNREKELLNHTLADRTAELQRQANKIQDTEESLEEAHFTILRLHSELDKQHKTLSHLNSCTQSISDAYTSYKSTFNQALTRIANYEQRLSFTTSRLNSVKATLSCHYAIVQSYNQTMASTVECGCQTSSENTPSHQPASDLTSYSREQLVQEVRCLSCERDNLMRQLQEATDAFQKQIESLTNTSNLKLSNMEGRLEMVQKEKDSLESQLTRLQQEHSSTMEQNQALHERLEQLEKDLTDTQATVETRVESAVLEEQTKNNEAVAEMEKLLNVARREHAKAVVQLQHLQRSLTRDRDRAVEVVEMSKARVEHELENCRKKLQATQIERNLLLTTLRQEGLIPPTKRTSPRQRCDHMDSELKSQRKDSVDSEDTRSVTTVATSVSREASPLSYSDSGTDYHHHHHCEQPVIIADTRVDEHHQIQSHHREQMDDQQLESATVHLDEETPLPLRQHKDSKQGEHQTTDQDIRVVLKDLQMLSASLLGMDSTTNQ